MGISRSYWENQVMQTGIGRAVRTARERMGLRTIDVAARLGVSPVLYRRIESGQALPRVAMLYQMAIALETKPSELMRPSEQTTATIYCAGDERPEMKRLIWLLGKASPQTLQRVDKIVKILNASDQTHDECAEPVDEAE